jgi:Ser/Thr protein kinase RdoA (MazF antagonist)
VKVRKLETAAAVDALAEVRRALPACFAPIVARQADLLVEAWVDGRTLGAGEANARAFELGSMMGALHRQFAQPLAPVTIEGRREQALAHVDELARRRCIPAAAAATLMRELGAAAVAGGRTIVHLDFCPENIVCDAQGCLHVIDNEWLRADTPGIDIGRSFARWPASDAAWARFLDGYHCANGFPPAAARFWLIAMAAASAMLRIDQPAPRAALPLTRLIQLAGL